MKIRFFNPGLGYRKIKPDIDEAIHRILDRGDLILREDVEQFEENLARYVGTKYAVALNSGTDALVLALKAAGLGRSIWSVSVPAHTFKATAGAVKTVAYDANIDVYDLGEMPDDPDIAVVAHIAGELYPIPTAQYAVIEDAAQALGAVKNPTSLAQTWSFYPAKILGAYGDAGALTTNDKNVYEYVKEARNHFKTDNQEFGINSRMDNLQAAVLNVKFKYLPEFLGRREEIAEMYYEGLKDLEESGKIKLPNRQKGRVYQDFILQVLE